LAGIKGCKEKNQKHYVVESKNKGDEKVKKITEPVAVDSKKKSTISGTYRNIYIMIIRI